MSTDTNFNIKRQASRLVYRTLFMSMSFTHNYLFHKLDLVLTRVLYVLKSKEKGLKWHRITRCNLACFAQLTDDG